MKVEIITKVTSRLLFKDIKDGQLFGFSDSPDLVFMKGFMSLDGSSVYINMSTGLIHLGNMNLEVFILEQLDILKVSKVIK